MKKTLLAVLIATAVTGCSVFSDNKNPGLAPSAETQTPVKDTKISTEFTDEGVKLYYTMFGKLDRIEVYGQAPAWKGNVDVIAEADAMDKLVKFVHGKSVTSDRRVKIVAKSLDRARDNTVNRFKTVDGVENFNAKELENSNNASDSENSQNNTSRRVADRVENSLVTTVNSITSRGRLTGVRKIRDEVRADGRVYVAVYQWSERDQTTSEYVRNRMR